MWPVGVPTHARYLDLLHLLRPLTQTAEIVLPYHDAPDDPLLLALEPLRIGKDRVSAWSGTRSRGIRSTRYRYRAGRLLFEQLAARENFFGVGVGLRGQAVPLFTEIGDKDVAFFDEREEVLFYSIAHEGEAFLREDLLRPFGCRDPQETVERPPRHRRRNGSR